MSRYPKLTAFMVGFAPGTIVMALVVAMDAVFG